MRTTFLSTAVCSLFLASALFAKLPPAATPPPTATKIELLKAESDLKSDAYKKANSDYEGYQAEMMKLDAKVTKLNEIRTAKTAAQAALDKAQERVNLLQDPKLKDLLGAAESTRDEKKAAFDKLAKEEAYFEADIKTKYPADYVTLLANMKAEAIRLYNLINPAEVAYGDAKRSFDAEVTKNKIAAGTEKISNDTEALRKEVATLARAINALPKTAAPAPKVDLSRLESELREANRKLDALKGLPGKVTALSETVDKLDGSIGKLGASVGTLDTNIGMLDKRIGNIGGKLDDLKTTADNFGGKIDELKTSVRDLDKSLCLALKKLDEPKPPQKIWLIREKCGDFIYFDGFVYKWCLVEGKYFR